MCTSCWLATAPPLVVCRLSCVILRVRACVRARARVCVCSLPLRTHKGIVATESDLLSQIFLAQLGAVVHVDHLSPEQPPSFKTYICSLTFFLLTLVP